MVAPRRNVGTRSPRTVADGGGGGSAGGGAGRGPVRNGAGGPNRGVQGGRPNANSKGRGGGPGGAGGAKGNKKKRKGKSNFIYNMQPLNPDFDPRIRRIGSPLNASDKIKRGWIQTEEDNLRVNFLFNPSQLDLSHQTLDTVRTSDQVDPDDVVGVSYASMGSTTGVKLLYDRTYELFSPPANGGGKGFANRFGVWADVAAWYVLLGMLPTMPTSWENSLIVDPPQPKRAYLFVGPKMLYYGRLSGLEVTYSHWTQNMIPARCAVTVGFEILPPANDGDVPLRGKVDASNQSESGWRSDWLSPQVPDFMP